MKGINQIASHLGRLSSGASLGGKVVHYRDKQNICKQGMHAYTLFYIQEGGCASPPDLNINLQQLPRSWGLVIFLASSLRRLSPSRVHRRRVDRQFHSHHQKGKDAPNASQEEKDIKPLVGLSTVQRQELSGSRGGPADLLCRNNGLRGRFCG
jgi:hypothetical protein